MDKAQKIVESMLKAAANDVNSDGYGAENGDRTFERGHAMALFFSAKRVADDFGIAFEWSSMGEWETAVRK